MRGLKVNTVCKTIRHLKSFLKDKMSRKIIPYFELNAYKVQEEEVDTVYISWLELSQIHHLDLSRKENL